ncbi:MAG TPA: bifunctional 3-phenylpropionate/cinnamic acid dioxygenase ferredoxin subunit [Symbiobacteriaceae bacterium]|jgi:3-phenylpropionate/trans-cinnamate dioxygenase ferredoxin subunit
MVAKVKVAEISDIPEGTAKRVLVKRHPIALYHIAGKFYATDDTCSHAEASLAEGTLQDGCKVACPLHGAQFDVRTGAALTMPAVTPVETYRVSVEGTAIFVEV